MCSNPIDKTEGSPSKLRLKQLTDKLSTLQFGANEEQQVSCANSRILGKKRGL